MKNRLRPLSLAYVGVLLVALIAGCGASATDAPLGQAAVVSLPPTATATPAAPLTPEQQLAAGIKVYDKYYCGTCHALTANGSTSQFGPTHDAMVATAEQRIKEADYSGTAKTAEEYIRESITHPETFIVADYRNTTMPMPTYRLTEAEVNNLVKMLLMQK